MSIVLFIFLSFNSHSQYLSYTQTSTTKIDMKLPSNVPKMMMRFMPGGVGKPEVTTLKYYITPKITASLDGDRMMVMNYESETQTQIDHAKRKYTSMTFAEAAKEMMKHSKKLKKQLDKAEKKGGAVPPSVIFNQNTKYKKTKKIMTVSGLKCRVYNAKIELDIGSKDIGTQKMNTRSMGCYMSKYPKALMSSFNNAKNYYEKYIESVYEGFPKEYIGMIASAVDFKYDNAPQGFELYNKSVQTMNLGGQAQMPAGFGPIKTISTMKVSKVSTKAFSNDLFEVPEGYKKVKRLK